jgi:hypothetical protein
VGDLDPENYPDVTKELFTDSFPMDWRVNTRGPRVIHSFESGKSRVERSGDVNNHTVGGERENIRRLDDEIHHVSAMHVKAFKSQHIQRQFNFLDAFASLRSAY